MTLIDMLKKNLLEGDGGDTELLSAAMSALRKRFGESLFIPMCLYHCHTALRGTQDREEQKAFFRQMIQGLDGAGALGLVKEIGEDGERSVH